MNFGEANIQLIAFHRCLPQIYILLLCKIHSIASEVLTRSRINSKVQSCVNINIRYESDSRWIHPAAVHLQL